MNKRRIISLLLSMVMIITGVIMLPVFSASAAAPQTVAIAGGKYVARGESIRLTATVAPARADQEVVWKSSDEKIATVSSGGKVTGIRAGVVKITAASKEDKSVKASLKIRVLPKAVKTIKITASTAELDLNGTKTVLLKAKASPSSALQEFTWKSSDPKVAKVSEKGKVTALKVGKAKITATANDGSKAKASITIKVVKSEPEPEPTDVPGETRYYALLIGNGTGYRYINKLSGIHKDVTGLSYALKGMSQGWKVTVKENLTVDQMKKAISNAFAGAKQNDICFFYYSGHGDDSLGSTGGALCGIECTGEDATTGLLMPTELRDCLKAATPGKVIVALDSCGSGSTIYQKNGDDPKNFTRGIINALSGVTIQVTTKTGELLNTKKFAVLAAAKHGTTSQGMYVTQQSLDDYDSGKRDWYGCDGSAFTYSLVRAMGYNYPHNSYNGSMGGDANGDGQLTLKETYDSIKSSIQHMRQICWEYFGDDFNEFSQETQMSGQEDMVLFIHE